MPTQLKVANRSFVVAESSPARDGAQRSEREKGGDHAPGDSKGRSPWHAFGDFPRDGKVTRGRRDGAPSTLRVEAKSGDLLRELCSHKGSAEGATPPRKEAGAAGPKGQHQLALRRRRTASSSASVSKRSV